MISLDRITHEDGSYIEVHDNGDGTGIEIWFDANKEEIGRITRSDLPIPQTPRETLVSYLDQMTDEQASPVLSFLGWISTLEDEKVASVLAVLGGLAQLTSEQALGVVPALLALSLSEEDPTT